MGITGFWDVKSCIMMAKFNYDYSRFLSNFGKFPPGHVAPFVTGAVRSSGVAWFYLAQDTVM
jgi:hypothetical protein